MKKIIITTLTALPLLLASPVWADDISEQIQAGLKAYEDKDYKVAVEELKFATALLEKLKSTENQKILPAALDGWTAEEVENNNQAAMAMLGGGSSMKSAYKKDKERVEIEVMANSPMMAVMSMMLKNPMMMASDKSMRPYRYNKIKGVKKSKGDNTEITLLIAGQIMLKVSGTKLKDEAVLEQYLDEIDIDKLKEAML